MKFSVIIPAYNIENLISRSINSVLNQTYKDYEVIVVNDCSTDNTLKEIQRFNNIEVINHDRNKGLGGARNSGIKVANGEFIIFLDGDDYLHNENVLQKLAELIGDKKADVIYMGFEMTGNRHDVFIPTKENCNKKYRAAQDPYPNVWSKCWNKNFLIDNDLWFIENRYYEDVIFGFNAIMKVKDYLIADFIVHTYVSGRKNSITTSLQFKNVYDTIDNIKDLIKIKKQNPSEEVDIKIDREIELCKKRLCIISEQYMNIDC